MRVLRALSHILLILLLQTVFISQALRPPLESIDSFSGRIPSNVNPKEVDAESLEYAGTSTSSGGSSSPTAPPETTSGSETPSETTTTPPPPPPTTTTAKTDPPTTPVPTTTTPPPIIIPRVTIEGLGTARGRNLTSFEGRPFYGFMSIPYALPPEEELRFQYPQPWAGPWPVESDEVEYDADFLRARCIQNSLILNITGGREDCLHLSIYTPVFPENPLEELLPVMVWFHGGAYMTGDANLYIPSKLMDRNVMVVVVQYRLGSLGFLAGGIPDAPGNMGLMDQIMSLRWIQKYIEDFGGDRDKVTVFGQSAGGASSSWMHVTPLTNGSIPQNEGRDLLHRVIPQSGSALELWTIDPLPEDGFQLTAETLECWDPESLEDSVYCMRKKTADEVNKASVAIYAGDRAKGGLGFKGLCPVIQTALAEEYPDEEIVIPKAPGEILANGEFMKIPMMAGSVRDEGALVVGLAYKDFMYPNNHTIDDFDFVKYDNIPTLLKAFGLSDQNGAVRNSMRVAYFPYAEMGNWTSMVGGMIDMTGVLFLKSGIWEVANYVNRVEPDIPIYFYSWEFESDDSLFPWIFSSMLDVPVPGGISHADELLYLFHLPSDLDLRQRNMTTKMITLWSNFAKYGDPTPDNIEDPSESWDDKVNKWEKYTNDDYNFMLINDDFVIHQDFSTRWHYHRGDNNLHSNAAKKPNESIPDTMASMVPLADYEAQVNRADQLTITTGVFGGVLLLVVVAGSIFAIFQKMTRVNGVV